jgi:hypothetical protein
MVSAGSKGTVLSIKHLAKSFYFSFIFSFIKPNQKIWRTWLKALNFGLSTKPVLIIAIVTSWLII